MRKNPSKALGSFVAGMSGVVHTLGSARASKLFDVTINSEGRRLIGLFVPDGNFQFFGHCHPRDSDLGEHSDFHSIPQSPFNFGTGIETLIPI
jgi:hypothetical protein